MGHQHEPCGAPAIWTVDDGVSTGCTPGDGAALGSLYHLFLLMATGNPLEIDSANGEEVVFVEDTHIFIDAEGIVHKPGGTTWPEVDEHFKYHDLDGNPRDPSDNSTDGEWSSDDDTTTGTTSNVHVVTAVNLD